VLVLKWKRCAKNGRVGHDWVNILSTLGSASVDSPDLFQPTRNNILQGHSSGNQQTPLHHPITSRWGFKQIRSQQKSSRMCCYLGTGKGIFHISMMRLQRPVAIYQQMWIYCTRPNPFFCWILMDPYLLQWVRHVLHHLDPGCQYATACPKLPADSKAMLGSHVAAPHNGSPSSIRIQHGIQEFVTGLGGNLWRGASPMFNLSLPLST